MKTITPRELETAFVAAETPTLADVLDFVVEHPDLSPTRSRDLASGVRRLARIIDRPPEQIPADPNWLRPRVEKVAPAAHGLSVKRWANIVSDTKAALARFGMVDGKPSGPVPLSDEWRALWDRLLAKKDPSLAPSLGRFVRFLSRLGVAPGDVGDDHANAFRDAVALNEIRKSPEDAMQAAIYGWNMAVDRLAEWPRQTLPMRSRSKVYAFAADAFPASFQSDLDGFLKSMSDPDLMDPDALTRPLRPATVNNRRAQVLRIASALVHSGEPIEAITGLAVLVDPTNARAALRWLLAEKTGGEKTPGLADLSVVLGLIAKRRVKAEPEVIAELKRIEKSLASPREPGLTEKNRERLRPLQNEETLRRLVRLPRELSQRARGGPPTVTAARDMEAAVVIALLLYCPIRRRNVVELDLERNIRRMGDGRAALIFAKAEVKNHRPIEFDLRRELVELIDEHVRRYRPLLAPEGSTHLFPRRSRPGAIAPGHFSKQVSRIIRRETGIEINMHLFRHLAAWIWLEENPGSYEALRRLLGHAELSSTLNAYAGFEAGTATRLFADLIDGLSEEE